MDSAILPHLRRRRYPPPAPHPGPHLSDFMRKLAMPKAAEPWSLTSLRERLIKIGAKVVTHGRYVTFGGCGVVADVRRHPVADRPGYGHRARLHEGAWRLDASDDKGRGVP